MLVSFGRSRLSTFESFDVIRSLTSEYSDVIRSMMLESFVMGIRFLGGYDYIWYTTVFWCNLIADTRIVCRE